MLRSEDHLFQNAYWNWWISLNFEVKRLEVSFTKYSALEHTGVFDLFENGFGLNILYLRSEDSGLTNYSTSSSYVRAWTPTTKIKNVFIDFTTAIQRPLKWGLLAELKFEIHGKCELRRSQVFVYGQNWWSCMDAPIKFLPQSE